MAKLTSEISEIAGIFAGDGSMQPKHLCFWGNITEDKDHYDYIIKPLFRKSFKIEVNPHPKKSNSVYGFYVCRREIINYFHEIFDFCFGKKTYTVNIPKIIINSKNRKFFASFLRGFADADGTLSFDRRYSANYRKILQIVHTYPRIQLKSVSFKIIYHMSLLLKRLQLKHIICRIKGKAKKMKKIFL